MNNLKYFPFGRNRYYYGKLLTEQDFIQEQQYMNDKRRLHNRFFHGVGVVAGLRVSMIDEKSVSIEDGVAIDFSGREIVVDTPSVYPLSTIDGFSTVIGQNQSNSLYLCIEYSESVEMPAHNIMRETTQGEVNYDKSKEGYHLYLTDKEPQEFEMGPVHINFNNETIYEDSQVKIQQRFARYVVSGEAFETVISVFNKGNAATISVDIEEMIEGAFYDGGATLSIKFLNLFLERGQSQKKVFQLKARGLDYGSVFLNIQPEKIKVKIGKKKTDFKQEASIKNPIKIPIIKENLMEAMEEKYLESIMEDIVINNYPRGIYIAKIFLVKMEESYMLETVEQMPFQQYIYSTHLLAGMIKELERELKKLKELPLVQDERILEHFDSEEHTENCNSHRANGIVEIDLGRSKKRGQISYSHEIFHELGIGIFQVNCALQEADILYSGGKYIFKDAKANLEIAVKQNVTKASFVIGIRLLEHTNENSVRISWNLSMSKQEEAREEKHIYIVPGKLELKIRETYYLETICENIAGATVLWRVAGSNENNGSISGDGTYTAPNMPGVFEVIAQCQQAPELKASLFIVVRE